jgi:hypothetical protein
MKEIKVITENKSCAKQNGYHVTEYEDLDDEEKIPLADLMQLARRHLPSPMTSAHEYVEIDDEENQGDDWE